MEWDYNSLWSADYGTSQSIEKDIPTSKRRDEYDVVAALPFRYPMRYQGARFRRPLEEFVHRESYDRSKYRDDEKLEA